MIFDCVFLHRNVLEAVPSPGSPRAFPRRFSSGRHPAPRSGFPTGHGRAGVPLLVPLSPGAGTPRSRTGAGGGAGRAVPATSPGPARAGAGAVGVALGHAGYTTIEKLESSFCLSLVHFTDMKIEKGEIYEENLISHSCWMDLVWYWPDFTMCLLKALEYILYVKDCNNFKKKIVDSLIQM